MIKMEVQSTRAVIRSQEPLTVGLRGAKAQFTFGRDWDGLIKTAVFRQGNETVAVADVGQEVTIPWEVLTEPGVPVEIGVYGIDSTGNIAIPTLWASTHPVRPGADPSADPSAEPTPGLWEQMQGQLGSLEQLDTNDKSSLVAAVNEANRAAYVVTLEDKNGFYFSKQPVSDILAAHQEGKVILCDWRGSLIPLRYVMGSDLFFGGAIGITVYHIQVRSNKQTYITTYSLAEKDDIPEKVSDLENDSGYLTEAPVKSVNGQTGDVHLTIPTIPTVVSQLENDKGYLTEAPVTSVNGQQGDVKLAIPHRVSQLDNDLNFVKQAMGPVLYTPQDLTDKQKTQARKNLGIDSLLSDGDWEKVYELTTTEKVLSVRIPVDGSQYKALYLRGNIAAWVVADEKPYDSASMLNGAMCCGVKTIAYSIHGNFTGFDALLVNVGDNVYLPFVISPNGNAGVNGSVQTYNPRNNNGCQITSNIGVSAWGSDQYRFMEGSTFELWGVKK